MAMADVDSSAVQKRIDQLGNRFVTKDVSEDPEVRRRHGTFADHRNYHAQIGRWLSKNSSSLGIVKTGTNSSRGMQWEKSGARRGLTPSDPLARRASDTDTTGSSGTVLSTAATGTPSPALPVGRAIAPPRSTATPETGAGTGTATTGGSTGGVAAPVAPVRPAEVDRFGPQYGGDNPFTARMRFHQSWWRADVLGVPYGTGPRRTDDSFYGNMLDAEAADAGRNLLTPAIHDAARRRIDEGGGVEPFRCLRNLLSSQPMCFNLFAPLASMDPALATACVGSLLPDPADCVRVERTVIEYAPSPRAEYLDDRTAFDAFIEYERADGTLGFFAIETKLTEPFSQNTDHAAKYIQLARAFPEVWAPDELDALVDARWFQLWRNHLLAKRLLTHPGSPYTAGLALVVHHPLDRSRVDAVAGYRSHLLHPDREVRSLTIEDVADRWAPLVTGTEHQRWLDDFRCRYVDLSRSEAAWRDRSGGGLPHS